MAVNTRSTSRRVTRATARSKPPSTLAPVVAVAAKRAKKVASTTQRTKYIISALAHLSKNLKLSTDDRIPLPEGTESSVVRENAEQRFEEPNVLTIIGGGVSPEATELAAEKDLVVARGGSVNETNPMDSISGTSTKAQPMITRSKSSTMAYVLVPPPPPYINVARQHECSTTEEPIAIDSNEPLPHRSSSAFPSEPLQDFEAMPRLVTTPRSTYPATGRSEANARPTPTTPLPSPPSVQGQRSTPATPSLTSSRNAPVPRPTPTQLHSSRDNASPTTPTTPMPGVSRVRAQTPESSPLRQYPTRHRLSSIEEEATYEEGEYMYQEDQRQRQKGKKALKSRVTPKEVKNGDRKKTGNKPVEPLAGSGLAKKLKAKSRDREKATSTRWMGSNTKEPPTNAQVTTETPDGNLIDPEQSFREEESEDFEDNDDKFTGPFRPGPLSDAGAARAVAAHKAYIAAMYDIAKEERKPAHTVFAVVHDDDTPGTARGVNPWNAWLAHHAAHSGLEKPENWDASEWVCFLQEEYVKHVEERKKELNTDSVCEALAEEVSWFENWFSTFWEDKKREGKFGGTLSKIIAPVMNIAQHAYLNYGVHIFGYAISTKRDDSSRSPSCMFGGSPEFAVIKETQRTVLWDQLTDVESLLRVQEMEFRNVPEEERQAANVLECKGAQEKNARDHARTIFSRFLHQDTLGLGFAVSIGSYLREAVKNRLVIHNWPKGIAFPGCGGMTFHKLKRKELQSIIDTRITYVKKLQAGSVTDRERLERKFFKVERWIDAERELPATQVGDVAIVTDVDGDFVITVNDVLSKFPDLELTDGEEIDIDAELSKSRSKSKSKSRMTKANPAAAVIRSPSPNVLSFYVNEESPKGRANQAHSPSPVQQQRSSVEPVEPLAIRVGRRLMKYVEIDNFASPAPPEEVVRFDDDQEDLPRPLPRASNVGSRAHAHPSTSRPPLNKDSDSEFENLPKPPPRANDVRARHSSMPTRPERHIQQTVTSTARPAVRYSSTPAQLGSHVPLAEPLRPVRRSVLPPRDPLLPRVGSVVPVPHLDLTELRPTRITKQPRHEYEYSSDAAQLAKRARPAVEHINAVAGPLRGGV
ncbi:hypothetical protein PQX77_010637 [Marasmius sp. AFHP31]|nr:hypothetical protein PQX77_010637 [Marasmius sp. AFHP31]